MAKPKKHVESEVIEAKPEEAKIQVAEEKISKALEETKPSKEEVKTTPKVVVEEKSEKQINKALLQKYIDEETKLVKGRFRTIESPGTSQRIQIRKYPGIPMFDKVMKDGEMYEIPLYAARFLNGIDATAKAVGGKIGTCSYPVHGFKWNPLEALPSPAQGSEQGIPVPISGISKRVRRYAFESAEFDI